ncbi:MAG TPA: hypothetical protein VGT61_08625 [Thermomicrobiales bacterium]|jgi:hypothetical protein|nr:hypothetical protein [Thermomicrobiales bacterium]
MKQAVMGTMYAAERPVTTAHERARMRHKHIFVISGSQSFLDLLRDLLADGRYNVTTPNFVDRTLNMIPVLQPDLCCSSTSSSSSRPAGTC